MLLRCLGNCLALLLPPPSKLWPTPPRQSQRCVFMLLLIQLSIPCFHTCCSYGFSLPQTAGHLPSVSAASTAAAVAVVDAVAAEATRRARKVRNWTVGILFGAAFMYGLGTATPAAISAYFKAQGNSTGTQPTSSDTTKA
jgi:hypothetical protein